MGMLDQFRINRAINVLLSSPDTTSPEQTQAVSRLKQIGKPAIPRLIQALDRATNAVLTDLLASLLDTASLPLFCEGLKHQSPRVVAGTVKVLSQNHAYDPNPLLDLFTNPQIPKAVLVKVLAARKETLQPKALLNLLNVVDKGNRSAVFQLIEQVANASMVSALIPYTRHQDWLVRLHMIRTLSRFSTEAVRDALVGLLGDPHKNIRQAALEGLAGMELPVDAGPLCRLLRDPDLTVQSKAIETIIRIHDPKVIHHLLDILQDESEYVRRAAVEVLNAVGNTDAIKDLLEALRDQDWWVRVRASDALGHIGGPRVVQAILPLIKDQDEFIRRCAVEVLNTTRDERAFDYLVEAVQDTDWWVRERAVDALAHLGNKRAVPELVRVLEVGGETTPAVVRALAELDDPRAIRPLMMKLQSHDKAVRNEVLRALAQLTDETHAGDVQLAIVRAIPTFDEETQAVAQETKRALVSKFGETAGGAAGSLLEGGTVVEHRSLLEANSGIDDVDLQSHAAPVNGTRVMDEPVEGSVAAAAVFIDPMGLKPEDMIAGRYRVVRHIGRGAFGVVVLVEDQAVHEEIILKFLNSHLAANDDIIKRFVHEMRYTRKITHENVIRIYDFVTLGKSFAISMEYFPSHSLAVEIERQAGRITPRQIGIIRDICDGLSVAHHVSIVHRDLKPQNLLVNDAGLVKIVDFGLAAAVSHTDSRLTGSGVLMGTPTYMSPEQARGWDIDPRTDIYSLGVIMYEMFAGRPPYQGKDPISIIYQHVEGNATPPRQINPDMPPELEAIVCKAMAVDPDDRYQNVDTLRQQLEALLALGVG